MSTFVPRGPVLALLIALAPAVDAAGKQTPPVSPPVAPAEGFWSDPDAPGTGFSLEHRDGTVALAFFHFGDGEAGAADWHLATGTLEGTTLTAPLLHFDAGSCIGCVPFLAAEPATGAHTVQLEFASAREATLRIDEGEPRRVVALPYGVPYVDGGAAGDVPLPDLRGRWLVGTDEFVGLLHFDERVATAEAVEFLGDAIGLGAGNATLRCELEATSCALILDSLPDLSPAPSEFARIRPGDITEEQMLGLTSFGAELRALRLADAPATPRPAEGFWSVPGQPGSGVFFEQRGELLAAALYSYHDDGTDAAGSAAWWLGTGTLDSIADGMVLHAFAGGDCLTCAGAQQPAIVDGQGLMLALDVHSARRAIATIDGPGGAREVPLVSLPYGAEYVATLHDSVDEVYGALPLPDLRGYWAVGVEGDASDMRHTAMYFNRAVVQEDGSVRFDVAEHISDVLTCRAADADAPAGCSFQAGVVIGTPPPFMLDLHRGELFLPLGDIEEDRASGRITLDGEELRVRLFRVADPLENGDGGN